MKKLMLASLAICVAVPATAQVRVGGYFRSDGTYVAPHYRSSPNSTTTDNYSTYPNVNPYTGRVGRVNPYSTYTPYRAPSYGVPNYGSSYGNTNPRSAPSSGSSYGTQPRKTCPAYVLYC
jgi:hypothetical protein